MKSLFSMGFFSNDVFRSAPGPYLGQANVDLQGYLASVNDAMNKYQQVVSWVNSHPNYQQLLGGQASYFQTLYQQSSGSDYNSATSVQQLLQSVASDPTQTTATVGSDDKNATDAFISEVQQMLGIIGSAAAPGTPVPGSPAAPTLPGAISQLLPGQKPATPAIVPIAPPASSISTPLIVGGAILGVGLIVLLAKNAG